VNFCSRVAFFLALAASARAQVVDWNSASGGSWTASGDWKPAHVPSSSESASITLPGKFAITLNNDETIESLFLDSASGSLVISSSLTLSDDGGSSSIVAGTVLLARGRIFATSGSGAYLFSNAGTIVSDAGTSFIYGNGGSGTGMAFVNSGRVSVSSGTLYLGNGTTDTVSNAAGGTLAVGPGATLNLNGGGVSIDNRGTLQATGGGTINIMGPLATADLGGTISDPGSTINLEASLDNVSQTLAAPLGGAYTLDAGTINGGAVASGALTFSSAGGTLSGVTLVGNFAVPANAVFTASTDTVFTGGATTFAGNNRVVLGGTGTALSLAADATWIGNVAVTAGAANLAMVNNGTIKSAVSSLIYGGGNNGFAFTNNGIVESTGGTLSIAKSGDDVFTNAAGAAVEANGGNVSLGGASVSNLSGGTLAGGTWMASGSASISFAGPAGPIATIGPGTTLELIGEGSGIKAGPSNEPLEMSLMTNNGTLEVLGGRNFASTSSGLTNNGTLSLGGGILTAASLANGAGSVLSGFGTLNPTGGTTIGAGVLISPGGAGPNPYVGTLSFGANGGSLGKGGAYTFDIVNAASPIPGVDNDTISVAGALTITATPSDPFTLSLESINPGTGLPGMASFSPSGSYQWTLLSAASIIGFNPSDFTIDTHSFTNGVGSGSFFVTGNGTDLFLDFTPIPEPSTWALLGAGLAAVELVSARRRAGS
jgi:fibronectin-binding autotransporter adhesin